MIAERRGTATSAAINNPSISHPIRTAGIERIEGAASVNLLLDRRVVRVIQDAGIRDAATEIALGASTPRLACPRR
ncbi:MAG: hypothetical protein LCH92_03255 [Proteobacteria bacterium]|nr:hypothetical protein [Pseudomonadota bacterium]